MPAPTVVLADRGYGSDNIWITLVLPVIPMRKSRKKRIGVDHSLY